MPPTCLKKPIKTATSYGFAIIRSVSIKSSFLRPTTVSITGAHSNAGKTTIAERLLRVLHGRWAAVKYTKTAFYTSVLSSEATLKEDGKDTARLLDAGAAFVKWVQAPYQELGEAIGLALGGIEDVDGIVVEGNSPMDFIDFDCIVFTFGEDISHIKESAKKALQKAHVVLIRENSTLTQLPEMEKGSLNLELTEALNAKRIIRVPASVGNAGNEALNEALWDKCINALVDVIWQRAVERLISEYSRDGSIPFAIADTIGGRAGVDFDMVNQSAQALRVKIEKCEAGCF
jgi:hypothetical protein